MQQLCFQVSEYDLSYAIIDRESKNLSQSGSCLLKGRVADLKREEATNFLREQGLLDFDGEVSLAFWGAKTTLVPQVIFGDTNAKDVFELSFGTSEHIIEHTRFFEQALVNVYEIEEWVKRFFVIRYPRINIQHDSTHVLRGIFEKNTFQATLHIAIKDGHFKLIAVSKNQLDFFNTFQYSNIEDVLYYTTHVLNNLKYNEKEWSLVWHSDLENDEFFEAFSPQLKGFSKNKNVDIRKEFKFKHQLLCV